MKYTFPADAYGQECILLPVDRALIPIVSGALNKLLVQSVWDTREDYEQGYNAIAEVMSAMANNCLAEMVQTQKAIYRLLDTALNGAEYTEVNGVVTPDIPAAPAVAPVAPQGALYARLLGVQGTTGGFFGIGAEPVTLADVVKAGRVNNAADEGLIADGLEEVVGVLGSGGALASSLTNLLGTGADIATDGGLAAVQVATAFAQSAAAGLLGAQIDALTAELRLHNRRMFGADATGAQIAPAQAPAVRETLIFTQESEFGDPTRTPLANFLGERLFREELAAPIQYLSLIDTPLSAISNKLTDDNSDETVAELLADVAIALSQIRSYVGPPTASEGVSALVEEMLDLLSQVRPMAEGNDIYSALIAINDNTRRAADCCEEGLPTPTYPDPAGFACEFFPNLALVGEVEFTAPNQGLGVVWTNAGGDATMETVTVDGRSLLVTQVGGRDLCITVVAANEDTGAPYALGGNFNPYEVLSGDNGARPDVGYAGGVQQTYGPYWFLDATETEAIGYELNVSVSGGAVPQYPLRIYVFSGAVG